MIKITDSAQKHLLNLLSKQKKGTQIIIWAQNPGTIYAKCHIQFYLPQKKDSDYLKIKFDNFYIYFKKNLTPFIKDTEIDILSDELGTQISLKSPYLKTSINNQYNIQQNKLDNKNLLENQIRHILEQKINPQLAMHGGSISLIKVTQDLLAILQFHGGCNGCAMANYTIKNGVELMLRKNFPELKGVIDFTQHKRGKHSFF